MKSFYRERVQRCVDADTISYRAIDPDQCAAVVELHRRALAPDQIRATIFAGHGVGRYLASVLQSGSLRPSDKQHTMHGAWQGEGLVGYVHGRALPSSWHLNYIAVAPDHQSRGVGRQLWNEWLQAGRQRGYQHFSLDVERDNTRALEWYQRQGMQTVATSWLYEKDLQGDSGIVPQDAQLIDWENAEAWQTAFGFSRFRLVCENKEYSIGRLGAQLFRSDQPLPAPVEALLGTIDRQRRLLIVFSQSLPEWPEGRVSLRMMGAPVAPGKFTEPADY